MIESLNFNIQDPLLATATQIAALLLLCWLSYFITNRFLIRGVKQLVEKTVTHFDDIFLSGRLLKRISFIPPLVILYHVAALLGPYAGLGTKVLNAVSVWLGALIIGSLLSSLNRSYEASDSVREMPIKSYTQITKLIVYIISGLVILAVLLGKSPTVLLSGIGALTAVLMLVFRDTILSFVASLQITGNDLVKVGDWIEVPKYGADGDVIDIALHTVKVQNWDKTITVIPTHKLIEESFKNWRGMQQSGGRRIKRAVNIDISSIKFCDHEMLRRFSTVHLLKEHLEKRTAEINEYNRSYDVDESQSINGRRMTNIGCFQAYLKAY
ncbi:mechanosensitive ion channel family protein, partial [Calditrichota bacterium]